MDKAFPPGPHYRSFTIVQASPQQYNVYAWTQSSPKGKGTHIATNNTREGARVVLPLNVHLLHITRDGVETWFHL